MTPTNLPVQALPPATLSPAEAGASTRCAPLDFLLMLGQLVGAAVPKEALAQAGASTALPETAAKATTDDEASADAAELAAFMAMFAVPAAPRGGQNAANATAASSAVLDLAGNTLQGSSQVGSQAALLTSLVQPDALAGDPSSSADPAQLPMTVTDTHHAGRSSPGSESLLSRPVHPPVGSAAWADEIGSRLTLMAEQGKHTASLRLSPEHLGPLEIRVAVRDDQASVWFGAAHADTRAAIETALPRLRELFAAQGLALADAGVFHEPPRERPTFAAHAPLSGSEAVDSAAAASLAIRIQLGLIDAYA